MLVAKWLPTLSCCLGAPVASALHEDLPALTAGEAGEKLDAPVLLMAVAMGRIAKEGPNAIGKSSQ